MKTGLLSLLLLLSILLAACSGPPDYEHQIPPAVERGEDLQRSEVRLPTRREKRVEDLLAGMTTEEKVGQMFFVRVPEEGAAGDVSAYHLGGYILFGRDTKDQTAGSLRQKIQSWQDAAAIPLLIGVDEEGGTVVRVSSNPQLRETKFRSPQKLFAAGGLEAIRADAREKRALLASLGINVNLAPVVDVSTGPEDFIYDRSFGQDAAATADYAAAVVAEMEGVGSVLKHFPGYGDNTDTHTGVANDQRPYEQFLTSDFLPFRAGIEAGAGGVLVCHNIVACMDPDLPASLSPEVHRILREELGFTGVAMTDDLAMDAVKAYAEEGSAAVLAVLAGNDLVVAGDYREQIPQVIAAVTDGRIPLETVDTAVRRVLGWKYDLGLLGE